MESLLLSVEVIFPLFAWMLVGLCARRLFKLSQGWIDETNLLLFKAVLPVLLFYNMYSSDLRASLDRETGKVVAFCALCAVCTFVLLLIIVPKFLDDNPTRGAMVQAVIRSNTALYGIPVALSLYGEGNIGVIALLVASLVPLFNVISVVCLEVFRGGQIRIKNILGKIATNPLIIALFLGFLVNLAGISFASPIEKAITGIANIATPLSFIVLGSGFSFTLAAADKGKLAAITLLKLVVIPFLWLSLAVLLGFRGQYLAGVLVVCAPPTSVSSYPMSVAMGSNAQLSSEAVVVTSVLSIVSMFLWTLTLALLQLI